MPGHTAGMPPSPAPIILPSMLPYQTLAAQIGPPPNPGPQLSYRPTTRNEMATCIVSLTTDMLAHAHLFTG